VSEWGEHLKQETENTSTTTTTTTTETVTDTSDVKKETVKFDTVSGLNSTEIGLVCIVSAVIAFAVILLFVQIKKYLKQKACFVLPAVVPLEPKSVLPKCESPNNVMPEPESPIRPQPRSFLTSIRSQTARMFRNFTLLTFFHQRRGIEQQQQQQPLRVGVSPYGSSFQNLGDNSVRNRIQMIRGNFTLPPFWPMPFYQRRQQAEQQQPEPEQQPEQPWRLVVPQPGSVSPTLRDLNVRTVFQTLSQNFVPQMFEPFTVQLSEHPEQQQPEPEQQPQQLLVDTVNPVFYPFPGFCPIEFQALLEARRIMNEPGYRLDHDLDRVFNVFPS
jgi:hypothetical protein